MTDLAGVEKIVHARALHRQLEKSSVSNVSDAEGIPAYSELCGRRVSGPDRKLEAPTCSSRENGAGLGHRQGNGPATI